MLYLFLQRKLNSESNFYQYKTDPSIGRAEILFYELKISF